ncbi:hypothetical protein BH11PLA2_BH11PLA2_44030 [soil metagenome]
MAKKKTAAKVLFEPYDIVTILAEWQHHFIGVTFAHLIDEWHAEREWFHVPADESFNRFVSLAPIFTVAATKAGITYTEAHNAFVDGRCMIMAIWKATSDMIHEGHKYHRQRIIKDFFSHVTDSSTIGDGEIGELADRHNRAIYEPLIKRIDDAILLLHSMASHIAVFNNKSPQEIPNAVGRKRSALKVAAVRKAIELQAEGRLDYFNIVNKTNEHLLTLKDINPDGWQYADDTLRRYVNDSLGIVGMNWSGINSSNVEKALGAVGMK